MTTLRISFGRWCRQHRTRLHLTQAELARATGLARSSIADLESGRANPSLATVDKVATALDLHVDWLIGPSIVHDVG